MISGISLLVIIFLAIAFIVVSSSFWKVHPFISLLLACFGVGLAVGIPLPEIISAINSGFGGLMGYIGLIVVIGSIIGVILERSGAAMRIADLILNMVGKKRPALAMLPEYAIPRALHTHSKSYNKRATAGTRYGKS